MLDWLMNLAWDAILQIIVIDILLGGDNAVVIALACRNLPPRARRLGIIWGAAGAIILRVLLITVAVALLDIPLLKLVGGLLLVWIGVKLVLPQGDEEGHATIHASDKLWAAVKTIIVADFVMSLDNVIAIAGAAEHADPSQRTGLIIFGLMVSVPFIVFGSQLILKLLDRFPVIVLLGAGLLGWIAGGLIVGDVWIRPLLPDAAAVGYIGSIVGVLAVLGSAKFIQIHRGATTAR
jgi:YjbE family integral membrane protein